MRQFLPIILLCGCTGPQVVPVPSAARSEAEVNLRELAGARPRTGELVVTPNALQLRIRRGERTMPFLTVDRGVHQLGCYVAAEPTEHLAHEDAWWLFTTSDHAVALQLTTYGVHAWYWDSERDCPIRTAALDSSVMTDEVPQQYYKAEDAQIGYRWNQNETPFHSFTRLPAKDAPSVTGDEALDLLADVPGEELLIVEPNLISIRSANGQVLLQELFEIDPDWPCFNAQLNVFDNPGGNPYAIATFDTFGTMTDCAQVEGDSRYTMTISDWNPAQKRFVRSFEIVDLLRPLDAGGEDSRIETLRFHDVAGGALRVKRRVALRYETGVEQDCVVRDTTTGTCVHHRDCWRWSASNEREAAFTLVADDGVEVDLGTPRAAVRESGEDCGG